MGFTPKEAASLGIIGGADGPTAIFTTIKLAPHRYQQYGKDTELCGSTENRKTQITQHRPEVR